MKVIFRLMMCSFLMSCVFVGKVFAGNQDWQGAFTIQNAQGATSIITHSPDQLIVLSMIYTKHFIFGTNLSLNGFKPSAEGRMDVDMGIDEFVNQVKKFGTIITQQVTPGPTYA